MYAGLHKEGQCQAGNPPLDLQANSTGLQVNRTGMQGNISGMQGNKAEMQVNSAGMQVNSAGMQGKRTGMQGNRAGMQVNGAGMKPGMVHIGRSFDPPSLDSHQQSNESHIQVLFSLLKICS